MTISTPGLRGGLGVGLGSWFLLDPCHDLLEFDGQSGTGSYWPTRDRWRPQIGCEVVGTFPRYSSFKRGTQQKTKSRHPSALTRVPCARADGPRVRFVVRRKSCHLASGGFFLGREERARLLCAERSARVTTRTQRNFFSSDPWYPRVRAVARQASIKPSMALAFLIGRFSFHGVRIMLWINASATSGEWPRMVAHSSFGMSLVFLPTRL